MYWRWDRSYGLGHALSGAVVGAPLAPRSLVLPLWPTQLVSGAPCYRAPHSRERLHKHSMLTMQSRDNLMCLVL
jgi:hypothetical protein